MQEISISLAIEMFAINHVPDKYRHTIVVTRNRNGDVLRVMTTHQAFDHAYSLVRELDSLLGDLCDYSTSPPRSVAVHVLVSRTEAIKYELITFSNCSIVANAHRCMSAYHVYTMKTESVLQERLWCAAQGKTYIPF